MNKVILSALLACMLSFSIGICISYEKGIHDGKDAIRKLWNQEFYRQRTKYIIAKAAQHKVIFIIEYPDSVSNTQGSAKHL